MLYKNNNEYNFVYKGCSRFKYWFPICGLKVVPTLITGDIV